MIEHTPFDLFHRRTLFHKLKQISAQPYGTEKFTEMKGKCCCLKHPSEERKKVPLHVYTLSSKF